MKRVFTILLSFLLLGAAGTASWFLYGFGLRQVSQYQFYLIAGALPLVAFLVVLMMWISSFKKKTSIVYLPLTLILCAALALVTCNVAGVFTLPVQDSIPDFYGKTLVDAQNWASTRSVVLNTSFENSDNIAKYSVISQDTAPGTLTADQDAVNLVISSGPNYEKEVIVPNMLGWKLEEVLSFIEHNFLQNVNIEFDDSTQPVHTVLSMDRYGELKRNDPVTIHVSYDKSLLGAIEMVNMNGYSLFEAELWFKMHGIPYTVTSEFSDMIERHDVITTTVNEKEIVDPSTNVGLIISKGKQINVPDLTAMSVEEITSWVVDNNLSIRFSDAYDDKVELGKVISSNYKQNDVIEEGTVVAIVISKGQLYMPSFSSLAEFKVWASSYGIPYDVSYQYSDTVASGEAISYSLNAGALIPNGTTIHVVVSQGQAITIPNLIGRSYASARDLLQSLGLYVSYGYGGYNSSARDTVIAQSIASGTTVQAGTTVYLTLSSGPASTWTLYISAAQLGNSYGETVNSLSNYFAVNYPGVYFNFQAISDPSLRSGMIAPNSPTTSGSSVTQGYTYTIYVVQ